MIVRAKNEKAYVDLYLSALQGIVGITPREKDVAVLMILKYKKFLIIQSKLTTTKAKDEFDPMKELKKPEVLQVIHESLGMSFETFRNYVSSLKSKGFFKDKSINPGWIPDGKKAVIQVEYAE